MEPLKKKTRINKETHPGNNAQPLTPESQHHHAEGMVHYSSRKVLKEAEGC